MNVHQKIGLQDAGFCGSLVAASSSLFDGRG